MPVTIHNGRPRGWVALSWYSDYRKFGVTLKQLIKPTAKGEFTGLGVEFLKGKERKSVTFREPTSFEEVRAAMLSVEKQFGIPREASKYA